MRIILLTEIKMNQFASFALAAFLVLIPSFASAHQTQEFEINGEHYRIVVGSLNEPIAVDDKTGAYISVGMVGHESMAANDHHGAGGAVTGLEETLQVELIAGNEKKVLDLAPIHDEAGAYRAPFFPTVATTLSYRFFGEIDGTPVDLTFTCNPAGHAVAEDDEAEVEISEGVTRHLKSGSFGCPVDKEGMGFPESSADIRSLKSGNGMGTTALGVSVVALLATGFALRRKQ